MVVSSFVFTDTSEVLAVSGACSSHGGVNCSAGRQSNNAVYCKDGWRDSIAQYDFTVMCQENNSFAQLNSECVNQTTAYIKSKDTNLKGIDQDIDTYINDTMSKVDTSDPVEFQKANSHLNYLYTLRDRQNQIYIQMVIDSCKDYKPPQTQQTPPPRTLCDEKSDGSCVNEQQTYCSPSGVCLPIQREKPLKPIPPIKSDTIIGITPKNKKPLVENEVKSKQSTIVAPLLIENKQTEPISEEENVNKLRESLPKDEQTNFPQINMPQKENELIRNAPFQQGLASRLWAWVTSLF